MPLDWDSSGSLSHSSLTLNTVFFYFRRLVLVSLTRPDALAGLLLSTVSTLFPFIPFNTALLSHPSAAQSLVTGPIPQPTVALLNGLQGNTSSFTIPPILLLCTPGADAESLIKIASGSFRAPTPFIASFSLGSGDSREECRAGVERAYREGGWVFIRNLHLEEGEWLCGLLALAGGVGGAGKFDTFHPVTKVGVKSVFSSSVSESDGSPHRNAPHPDFRLIFTAQIPFLSPPISKSPSGGGKASHSSTLQQPCQYPAFPTQLLLSCTKIIIETPAGLRATFLRSLSRVREGLTSNGRGSKQGAIIEVRGAEQRLISSYDLGARLAWSHALILERRRYVPAGWSQAYDFCDADLDSAVATLKLLDRAFPNSSAADSQSPTLRSSPLRKLCAEALYGGRIENANDDSVLSKVLATCLGGGSVLSLESMLFREGGGGMLLKQGFLGQGGITTPNAASTSGVGESIRAPQVTATIDTTRQSITHLDSWEKWGLDLSPSLSPTTLGLSSATDLQQTIRVASEILRLAHI